MSERSDTDSRVDQLSLLDQGQREEASAQAADEVFLPDLSLIEEG